MSSVNENWDILKKEQQENKKQRPRPVANGGFGESLRGDGYQSSHSYPMRRDNAFKEQQRRPKTNEKLPNKDRHQQSSNFHPKYGKDNGLEQQQLRSRTNEKMPNKDRHQQSSTVGGRKRHRNQQQLQKPFLVAPVLLAMPMQQEITRPKLDSVVGVVLSFSTLHHEEMVDFFVYHFKQRKFSHMVKILRTKFPPESCQAGGWYRLLFPADFDIIEHFRSLMTRDGEDLPVLVPKRAVICQRRLSTRIRDEKVMFFVTASYKCHCPSDDTFLYKCRLGMLKLTHAELIDDAAESNTTTNGASKLTTPPSSTAPNESLQSTTSCSKNSDNQPQQHKEQQPELHEMPQRLKLWILPSAGAGDVGAVGYFQVKRIDARIWISNEPDSDSDGSSVNGDSTNGNSKMPLSDSFSAWFGEMIAALHEANRLSDVRRQSIEKFVAELQDGFRTETDNTSLNIELFGSALSGFGSNDCDIDLCLVNTGITKHENKNGVIPQEKRREWLNRLVQFMRKSELYTVISVADARTPIVKFEHHGEDGFHGDISVENGLALHNTELLRLYTRFDDRVSPLGFAVKRLAKLYGINDASAGSISSYAYIVMLIEFLQRVEPPVLPFLQNESKGEHVEGWNVSFQRELPEQFAIKNTQSIAQLFHDFLFYFAYQFDVYSDVAQIRTGKPYSKRLRRREIGCGDEQQFRLCVEDPFDLEHNLTSGVREDTLHYIIKCFRSAFRGMACFDADHFAAKDEEERKEGADTDGTARATPKMGFDELMRPFKPRRVVYLGSNNNNKQQPEKK